MARKCEACGKENPDYGEYCGACGRVLANVGAQPGRPAGSAPVCGRCGGPLEGSGVCPHCSEEYPDRTPLFKVASLSDPVTVVGATILAIGIASVVYALIFIAALAFVGSIMYTGAFTVEGGILGVFALLFLVFGAMAAVGGLRAMERASYKWAMIGALCAVVTGFILGTVVFVIAIVCLILVSLSRDKFPADPFRYRA